MPELSISLPVYNGGAFLRAALDGMLGQTFADFELLITDNGSTDDTPVICTEYARADSRVRYLRHDANRGATVNFERGAGLARGRFFKWMAHDDLHSPTYLERCIARLREDDTLALVHCKVQLADAAGKPLDAFEVPLDGAASPSPAARFEAMISTRHQCTTVFGVIRRELLSRTRLFSSGYQGSDRALLGELALLGRIEHLPDVLFLNRIHPARESSRVTPCERRARFGVPHKTLLRADYRSMIDRHLAEADERRRAHAALVRWWWLGGNFAKPAYERLAWHWPAAYGALQRMRGRVVPAE